MTFSSEKLIKVTNKLVKCCGQEDLYDHPAIYLQLDPETKLAICPYCSKKFTC